MEDIFLDNCSTTKICDQSLKRMSEVLINNYGNPSSVHGKGVEAKNILEHSRKIIADVLATDSEKIVFTPSGTYSNNLAILGSFLANRRNSRKCLLTSVAEHSSVIRPVEYLEKLGADIKKIKIDKEFTINVDELVDSVNDRTFLVSLSYVNNEVGFINPIFEIAKAVKRKNPKTLVHVDAAQAFCKLPLILSDTLFDFVTLSSHKVHGPVGIGALFVKNKKFLLPLTFGGNQEQGLCAGTEAVALAAGFAEAVKLSHDIPKQLAEIKKLYAYLRKELLLIPNISINSPRSKVSPYIINFSTNKIKSQTLLNFMSANKVYISASSACTRGGDSYVLKEAKIPHSRVSSSVRIGISSYTRREEIDIFISLLKTAVNTLSF